MRAKNILHRWIFIAVLGSVPIIIQAQQMQFQYQPINAGLKRIVDCTLKIDMLMHEETETGTVEDQSYVSTRDERRSATALNDSGTAIQMTFEKYTVEGEDTDPEDLKTVHMLLNKPYRIDLSDSSAEVTLNGDTVSDLERNFVENEYILFLMETSLGHYLNGKQLSVGDSLVIPSNIVGALFQGLQFIDVEETITLGVTGFRTSESGIEEVTLSFNVHTTRSDESAYIELTSTGVLLVDASTGRPLSITNKGTVEIVATENPSANRGSGTVTGTKLFTYSTTGKQ